MNGGKSSSTSDSDRAFKKLVLTYLVLIVVTAMCMLVADISRKLDRVVSSLEKIQQAQLIERLANRAVV